MPTVLRWDRIAPSFFAPHFMMDWDHEATRSVDQVIRDIRTSKRLPGVERIFLPGEQSHAKLLERRAHGVPMPKALRDSLDGLARDLNIAPLE